MNGSFPEESPQSPDQRHAGHEIVSWLTALGFFLIGAMATLGQSVIMWAPFIFLYIIIILVGWIPFVVIGGIIAVAGWKLPKLRWYGLGMIGGAFALYWPLAVEWYLIR